MTLSCDFCMLQDALARHQPAAKVDRRPLIRPVKYGIVVCTNMLGSPSGACLCVAFEVCVGRTHDVLADVVEAVGRVVRNLFGQVHPGIALLIVLYYVGETVQLMEHRHHVGRAVVGRMQRRRR